MDWILPLLGGLGIGSLFTTALQAWINRRSEQENRAFIEKRDAYNGLVTALHEAAIHPSEVSSKNYAL